MVSENLIPLFHCVDRWVIKHTGLKIPQWAAFLAIRKVPVIHVLFATSFPKPWRYSLNFHWGNDCYPWLLPAYFHSITWDVAWNKMPNIQRSKHKKGLWDGAGGGKSQFPENEGLGCRQALKGGCPGFGPGARHAPSLSKQQRRNSSTHLSREKARKRGGNCMCIRVETQERTRLEAPCYVSWV